MSRARARRRRAGPALRLWARMTPAGLPVRPAAWAPVDSPSRRRRRDLSEGPYRTRLLTGNLKLAARRRPAIPSQLVFSGHWQSSAPGWPGAGRQFRLRLGLGS